MTNLDKWMEVYEVELAKARLAHPDQYPWPAELLPTVCSRMRAAIERRSYNKDGYAFKATCKHFRIKHTYSAIEQFLKGE